MVLALPSLRPAPARTAQDQALESATCGESAQYFIETYVQIYAAQGGDQARDLDEDTPDLALPMTGAWVPFQLWPAQVDVLRILLNEPLVLLLKARQLGLSWLVLAYLLWRVLFRPITTALIFSKRETEAKYLLGERRLQGMYNRLPRWLQAASESDSKTTDWILSTGSNVTAFPATGGDGRTASIVFCDEFDLVETQDALLESAKPTIDAGGQMILLSKVNKRAPNSAFQRLYIAGRDGRAPWRTVFLPWQVRPSRTQAWYDAMMADVMARTGGLDSLWANYPATDSEALAPPSLNKRIPAAWLLPCYAEGVPQLLPGAPALPGLTIYAPPAYGTAYVIGADPAEGNPTSDPSSATVVDVVTGREVAHLAGQFEPTEFAGYLAALAAYYALNRGRARPDGPAGVLVERNNHGHAVLAGLRAAGHLPLAGLDGRPGWLSSPAGKVRLYDVAAQSLKTGDAGIATFQTYVQLASIESATLRAPEGQHDDDADSWALAQAARTVQTVPLSTAAPSVRRALAGFRG